MTIPCHLRVRSYKLAGRAITRVQAAKKKGLLKFLDGSVLCVDCGKAAQVYDHRDYRKPLEVDPVCQACNLKRGPAVDLKRWLKKIRKGTGYESESKVY